MSSKSMQIIGGPGRNAAHVDYQTAALTVQNRTSRLVHDGRLFSTNANGSATPVGLSVALFVITGPKAVHARFGIIADNLMSVELFEDTVVSANGFQLPLHNRDRTSATTMQTLVYANPTVTSDGTTLVTSLTLPSEGETPVGAFDGDAEWILKPNANYMVRASNNLGAGGPVAAAISCLLVEER